ncbi:hypothetical protein ACA514_27545 [Actinomadura sp. NTSP31]
MNMGLNTDGITPEILVTDSKYMPGTEVIEVPGLGYWATRESAQDALDKLARGVCPMTHETETGLEPQRCRICGKIERITSSEITESTNQETENTQHIQICRNSDF